MYATTSSAGCHCSLPLKLLARLHLWNAHNLTPNAVLERYYRDRLYGDRCVYQLPEQPMLHILTTNVSSGGMSVFNRNGLYIQLRDKDGGSSFKHIPGQMAGIPKVVGASSAFPGFFPPVEINAGRPRSARRTILHGILY